MKKLLFLAAFLLPMAVNAQYGSLVEQPTGGGWGSIVRVWQDSNKVLSYGNIVSGQQNVPAFCLSDYSQFYSSIPSTPALSISYADIMSAPWSTVNPRFTNIHDMRIVDDIAFVCGSAVDTNYPNVTFGAIGWFRLSDFASPNPTLDFYYYDFQYVNYFKKLAVYPCGAGYTVLALGETYNYTEYIVEVKDVTVYSAPPMYFRFFNATSFWDKEAYDDILVSRNEVFLVGQLRSSGDRQLCIRKADRNDVINDPQLGFRYDYTAPINEINAETRSALIGDTLIATAYVHANTTPDFTTRLRFIKTSSMDMVNSQDMMKEEKWEPEEMVYLETQRKLVLLQEFDKNWNFTILFPSNTTPYMADYLFHPQQEFHSLDGDYNKLFVSTGSDHWLYFQRLDFPFLSPTICPEKKIIYVKPIENVPTGQTYQNFNPNFNRVPEKRVSIDVNTILSRPICNTPLNVK